jgi:YHS domain-containing protein
MRFPIVLLAALSLAAPACRGCGDPSQPSRTGEAEAVKAPALDKSALPDAQVTCPVCGLEFDARESVATRVHNGVTYYFLLEDHARAFAADPDAYLKPAPGARDAGAAGDRGVAPPPR